MPEIKVNSYFAFSRAHVIKALALCVLLLSVGCYLYANLAKLVNRIVPNVPGSTNGGKTKHNKVTLSSTILGIVKDRDEASYPISDLNLKIFKFTKGQNTHICITRDTALPVAEEVSSITFSYLGRNDQSYEGILFSRDPSQAPGQLQFGIDRINHLIIFVTKTDGSRTLYTFTTQ